MTRGRFEQLCRKQGLVPVGLYECKFGTLLIAERLVGALADPEFPGAHYETVWTLERNRGQEWAQSYYSRIGHESQNARVNACIVSANDLLKDVYDEMTRKKVRKIIH